MHFLFPTFLPLPIPLFPSPHSFPLHSLSFLLPSLIITLLPLSSTFSILAPTFPLFPLFPFLALSSFCLLRSHFPQGAYIFTSTTVSVPSLELRTPHPLSRRRVCFPPEPKGRVHTCLRVRGWGSPNSDDWRESFVLCLLCAISQSSENTYSIFLYYTVYH
jgi:hypothetical protein